MTAFYNEPDKFAAQWLRNLIEAGHIAPGVVDDRDIREVEAYELAEFTQVHLFAGIGVWSYALRRSGWRDDERIWTGSCPCPPFSQAGKGQTCPACGSRRNICHPRRTGHFICLACGCDRHADDRHLWPEAARLIRDGKPPVFVGEQVASADGRIWLGAVSADLQTMGYAVAGADICAAGFGGAHIRQREYFVGLADDDRQQWNRSGNAGSRGWGEFADGSSAGGLADDDDARREGRGLRGNGASERAPRSRGMVGRLADDDDYGRNPQPLGKLHNLEHHTKSRSGLGDNAAPGDALMLGRCAADWLYCRDGKWRPVESGTFPLVDATPSRVGRLRAYGNALDAETATQFCGAVRDILRPVSEYDL